MPSWRIDPAQVRAVLDKVQPEIAALNETTSTENLDTLLTDIAECNNLVPTDCVEAAMVLFMSDQMTELYRINNRLTAGMVGVSTAVAAYQSGNTEMAAAANQKMWASADTGDFCWFTDQGSSTPASLAPVRLS